GTFMAITLFAAGLGRDIFPHKTSAAMSRLTVIYGIGQILGPLVATQPALHYKSYNPALLTAAGIAGIATIVTLINIREPRAARPLAKQHPFRQRRCHDKQHAK
ncbi:MAG: YbfB/YjiJ family MFS transporter, partial [Vulcanimicrobiaceae bacterium]